MLGHASARQSRTFDFVRELRLNRGCATSLNRDSAAAVVVAAAALNVSDNRLFIDGHP